MRAMPPLYLVEQGAKLSHDGHRLVVTKDGETLASVPLIHVSEVLIFGNVQVTTPVLKTLLSRGVDVVFLTEDGRHYYGRLVGPPTKYGELRLWQYERARQAAFGLALAQRFVGGKLRNMRTLLQRYNREMNDPEVAEAVEQLAALAERAPRTQNLHSLQGVEGKGSALYFGVFKRLFKADWGFQARRRRPPTDPLNVLLSFGYTLLAHALEAAVNLVGLDPYIGFLHTTEYGRPSLALDLMEEFRPLVVDSVVLRACNGGIVRMEDFAPGDSEERPIVWSEEGRKRFIQEFEARLALSFLHPRLGERVTYRRCFELQVRHLADCLKQGITDYQPFIVR
jgi:CRISPR-associated protein Cas1